jgi:hypothetical protein
MTGMPLYCEAIEIEEIEAKRRRFPHEEIEMIEAMNGERRMSRSRRLLSV